MKIKEEFPLTVPKLVEASGYHASLVKKLMPAADKWSGTTPRWRAGRILPKFGAALLMAELDKAPRVEEISRITPSDLASVIAWMPSVESAQAVKLDYARNYWETPARRQTQWVIERAQTMGGVKL